jgi:SET domain-containing protein
VCALMCIASCVLCRDQIKPKDYPGTLYDFKIGKKFSAEAGSLGNIGRFFNHACRGNLKVRHTDR